MSEIRLVIVQGPAQLLTILSVLRSQEENGEYRNCDDFLIMGGYGDQKLNKVCLQISQIWKFKERLSLHEFESFCSVKACEFLTATDLLKKYLKIPFADVVYTCRNWQFVNEVFLSAYPSARKICYGDSLGLLNLNSTNSISKSLNPSGFIPIDDSYLITPIDCGKSFDICKVRQIKPEFFEYTVADSAKQIDGLSEYCKNISNQFGNSLTIALTSYETEAGLIKNYQDEINCYLSSILPYTQIGENILVKGHLRQQLNQAQVLARELCKHKRNALVIPEWFTRVPIDLFCVFLKITKAFTSYSSACVSIAYLCQSELVIGYGEKIINKFYENNVGEEKLIYEHIFSLAVKQAYTKKFEPIKFLDIREQITEFHQDPIWIKPTTNMQYQIQSQVTEKDIIQWFHQLYYNAAQQRGLTWQKTYWMGIPVYKCPLDLWIYQEIIFKIKPEIIIETGTLYGGSALFLAQMCDIIRNGEIVSIDIQERPNRPQHPRISYWLGSSTSDAMIEQVRRKTANKSSVVVILDSDHRAEHVLQELYLYSPFVTPGSYLIVEDTNINGHPVYSEYGPGPMEAVQAFMQEDSSFDIDQECEKLYLTFNPSGYLKKRNIQILNNFTNKFSLYIQEYQKDPGDPLALANLRQLRYETATELLNLQTSQIESLYMGELGKKYQLLLKLGLKNEQLAVNEQTLVDEVLTDIFRGVNDPHTIIQYLMVAMLYLDPQQLPAPPEIIHIPHWLLNDYETYLFNSHSYFQKIGDADNYYRYIQCWIDYLHSGILERNNSEQWNDFLECFVKNANFIPVYFNDANLQDIYVKRAKIIEYFLTTRNYGIDYEFAENPVGGKKITLGILASNFLPSAETFAALPVYEYISRDFEVILYSLNQTGHQLEQYCQSCANSFKLLPQDLTEQVNIIRADDLDILFIATNVTAVTNQICLLSMHRLARIQVTSGGSVVTTGMRHIDYYISGTLTDPSATAEQQYQEKLMKLEGTAHCFSYGNEKDKVIVKSERQSLGIPDDAVIFISAANYFKIIPELIDTWAKIIFAVPNSVLVLLPFGPNWSNAYPKKAFVNHLNKVFSKHGITADQLIVLDPQPVPNRQEVKAYFAIADVYLDSFPFAGTTSLIEPLQVNLPVITRRGTTFRSTMGAAMVQVLDVPDLVADSEESYIQLAITLGTDPELRQQKSDQIKEKMQGNPSFLDSRSYSAKIGSLFQELFSKYLTDTLSQNFRLKDINLIIFPDWSEPEDLLYQDLASVISTLTTHPDKSHITLLIDTHNVSEEEADMLLSSLTMNLLMEGDVDITEGPEISLLGKMSDTQWKTLLPRINTRIALATDNQQAIAQAKAETLPYKLLSIN
ncbi:MULTISPECIES: CmcI family methyltransferase [unclassified Nostoc]|uniref:CmcI family methyltransferase n=1 Tax=unclassified Nostoc TaxID=2593658 RepID=UPI002618FA7D|nr:CmcI family methyltransferase [Nostoc sp. S13]MDF5734215.1 CmcI family methyltransferase [Nostoc sp. S13]